MSSSGLLAAIGGGPLSAPSCHLFFASTKFDDSIAGRSTIFPWRARGHPWALVPHLVGVVVLLVLKNP